ncbi:hypothetical protein ABT352_33025 [Streptosporangium sp. NPDC000563]|uniref:hypothetical protein n=1 Tax=Streptosporangium sp. NPDC000563 TaxID=3154366 RepID=UPI0033342572
MSTPEMSNDERDAYLRSLSPEDRHLASTAENISMGVGVDSNGVPYFSSLWMETKQAHPITDESGEDTP